jgi:hypothetical protein
MPNLSDFAMMPDRGSCNAAVLMAGTAANGKEWGGSEREEQFQGPRHRRYREYAGSPQDNEPKKPAPERPAGWLSHQ